MKYNSYLTVLLLFASCSSIPPKSQAPRTPASISSQLQSLDPAKPTVCTVTINSDEERLVFESKLTDFNFIELADTEEKDDWLLTACRKKVSCDVLLFSGHFAGSFFGKSPHRLSMKELETASCNPACEGVLKRPKEVFLMGCNTLAGKGQDHRSPDEYVRVLVADGFSQSQAEHIAAFRYSPIGNSFGSRMQTVFTGKNTRLYGFSSVGPSGKNVEMLLKNYLNEIGSYSKHLQGFDATRENQTLARALSSTSFAQTAGRKGFQSAVCILSAPEPLGKKVAWIQEILKDELKTLSYLPNINEFLGSALLIPA